MSNLLMSVYCSLFGHNWIFVFGKFSNHEQHTPIVLLTCATCLKTQWDRI